ncbi:MAG: hypothetical protein GY768_27250 [Planctomycetaceae bacterium]|nr:hypothetical protein [Planctomycetaceae bacterium]
MGKILLKLASHQKYAQAKQAAGFLSNPAAAHRQSNIAITRGLAQSIHIKPSRINDCTIPR